MASALEQAKPTVRSADGTLIWAAHAGQPSSEAPTIVFVPGFGFPSLIFTKQFTDEDFLRRFSMITYEPRGQGRSDKPQQKDAYSSLKNAQDFQAVCDTFGAKRVVLAGWSYGGIIGADVFANLGPHWVSGILLLSGVIWRSMHELVVNQVTFGAIMSAMAPTSSLDQQIGGFESFMGNCFLPDNLATMPYSLVVALLGSMIQQKASSRILMFAERHQDETKLLAHSKTLPVALIIGEQDACLYPDKLGQFIKTHFAKGKVEYIKGAGHTAFYEKSGEVNGLIKQFANDASL